MPKSMTLIWRLLRKHISLFELTIFFIVNLIGMTVIIGGVQLYSDVKPILSGEDRLIGNDYLVVTRPVERVGVGGKLFSEEDIADFRAQEFVEKVGEFTPSQYKVYGSMIFGGRALSTMLFFESVPDDFLDVKPEDWVYDAEKKIIPIILPRNYLNLYNFGFSSSQELPQITEDVIGSVELDVVLQGSNGLYGDFRGSVVAFSDRLNTILVPEQFMLWANEEYGDGEDAAGEASRLIIEVEDPTNPELVAYLQEKGYEIENKPAESSKAMHILKVCVVIIVCVGVAFSLLSLIILTLSIYLLLQKNVSKLENLVLIGYTPARVALPYNLITLALNITIWVISSVVIVFVQRLYIDYISQVAGYELSASPMIAIVVGALFTALIIAFNFYIINRKIREISRKR